MKQKETTFAEKLRQPKNKLRMFSYSLYLILFGAWFMLDFSILYLAMGLFVVLIAKLLFAYYLAQGIETKEIKPKKVEKKRKRKKKEK